MLNGDPVVMHGSKVPIELADWLIAYWDVRPTARQRVKPARAVDPSRASAVGEIHLPRYTRALRGGISLRNKPCDHTHFRDMKIIGLAGAPRPIRVLLVDDHPTLLWGLERLIATESTHMTVVGSASTGADALRLAQDAQPDVISLDLDLGAENGIDLIPVLLERSPARILVFTGLSEPSVRDRAVLAGARGIVGKDEPVTNYLQAIKKVYEGELWLDRSATGRVFVELSRALSGAPKSDALTRISRLTPREREVVRLLALEPASTVKNLAQKHALSEKTLRNHLTSIYEKLGVSTRLELHMYATAHRLDVVARPRLQVG